MTGRVNISNKILQYLRTKDSATIDDIKAELNLSHSQAYQALWRLSSGFMIFKEGDKEKIYRLVKRTTSEPVALDTDVPITETKVIAVRSPIDDLIEQLISKVSDEIYNKLEEKLNARFQPFVQSFIEKISVPEPEHPADKSSVKQEAPKIPQVQETIHKLPKICVTGLLPVHCGRIVEEFSSTFDILFWNDRTGNNMDQLKQYARSSEAVFWHTKHCSHSAESVAKMHNEKLIRVNGGLSQMRDAITKFYVNNTH